MSSDIETIRGQNTLILTMFESKMASSNLYLKSRDTSRGREQGPGFPFLLKNLC